MMTTLYCYRQYLIKSRFWLFPRSSSRPKKVHPDRWNDDRLISHTNQALKMFLKILHKTMCNKSEWKISFIIQVLIQKCRDANTDITIKHKKIMDMLQRTEVDDREIKCIENLTDLYEYWNWNMGEWYANI